jgi:hypothetical protein
MKRLKAANFPYASRRYNLILDGEQRFMMRHILILAVLSLLALVGCDLGSPRTPASASLASPSPSPAGFPSLSTTTLTADKSVVSANQPVTVTVDIKDKNGDPFSPGNKWGFEVQVGCEACTLESDISVAFIDSGNPNQLKFTFTPLETNTYSVAALFNPHYAEYQSEFPNGLDEVDLFKQVALVLERFDVCSQPSTSAYHGLKGTLEISGVENYVICSAQDLVVAAGDAFFLDKNLMLVNDIDVSDHYNLGGAEFAFGTYSGVFNGNYKTITGFAHMSGSLGLFTELDGGQVKNMILANSQQSGISGGALVGSMFNNASLVGVQVNDATLSGTGYVGGIVGEMESSTIANSSTSSCEVTSNLIAGGIIGHVYGPTGSIVTTTESSSAVHLQGQVGGESYVGGLVGVAEAPLWVEDSSFIGSLPMAQHAGDLAGSCGDVHLTRVALPGFLGVCGN